MMDMPVITASRLKSHNCKKKPALRISQRIQKRITNKILSICCICLTCSENILLFKIILIHKFHDNNTSSFIKM